MQDPTKQLKKSDFLSAVAETPMTRDQLVEALADFEYISSYIDYLTEHFIAQGKMVKNEDGTVSRKPRKGAVAKNIFRVSTDDTGENVMESKENVGILSNEDKEAGWSVTRGAAVKKACSLIFASYKEQTAAIKLLEQEDEAAESTDDQSEASEDTAE